MKKLIKWLLISIALIIVLVFANGCYYVFRGQERSMAKLREGRDLNLYECGSIYTMHTAIWMFGRCVSPEAARQAYLMTKVPSGHHYYSHSNDFIKLPKESLEYKLAFPENLKIDSQRVMVSAGFYDLAGNYIDSERPGTIYECEFDVTYSNMIYKVGNIKIYGTLLKYIQDKGWINGFRVHYSHLN